MPDPAGQSAISALESFALLDEGGFVKISEFRPQQTLGEGALVVDDAA